MNKKKVVVKSKSNPRELERLFDKDFNNQSKSLNKKWRSHEEDCDCKNCNE